MVICQNCGKEVGDVKFCGNCGTEIAVKKEENNKTEKFCGNCGAEIKDDIKFCPKCGEGIAGKKNVTSTDSYKKDGVTPVSSINVVKINDDVNVNGKTEESPVSDDSSTKKASETLNISKDSSEVKKASNASRSSEKSPILAAILSFFIPGLGHLYAGLIVNGLVFLFLGILCFIFLIILLILTNLLTSLLGVILYLFVWAFAIFDSFVSCEKINKGQ